MSIVRGDDSPLFAAAIVAVSAYVVGFASYPLLRPVWHVLVRWWY